MIEPTAKAMAPVAARALLPARDLGRVVVVQGPGALSSLVRIADGRATCDCAHFTTAKVCAHIVAAARVLRGSA